MRRGGWALVVAAVSVVAGCGEPTPRGSAPRHILFVRSGSGLLALGGDAPGLSAADAVAAPDFSVVAAAERRDGATVVERIAPSGEALDEIVVEGQLAPRVLSRNGDLVALGAPRRAGSTPYLPEGRTRTRLVVLDAGNEEPRAVRDFELAGNFEPEAFSTDGSELFLIEYLPAADPERYRVRRLKLENGSVVPIGRLKTAAPEQMQGTGRTQVYSPHGHELYTLYTQQTDTGHTEGHHPGDNAFVHLLNLEEKWAHCIDLPPEFAAGPATASALATSPGGDLLYVVDWSNGAVAVVRPDRVRVSHTVAIDFGAPDSKTFAHATDDRLYVAGNEEVVVLESPSLREVARWSVGDEVEGLGVAPDGGTVYVSVAGEIKTLDARTGRVLESVALPDAGRIEHVVAP